MPYAWKSLQEDFIDQQEDFHDAINAQGMDTLVIDADVTLSSDEVVPTEVRLFFINGYKLTIATGKTLTINGKLDADLFQIFDLQGTGKVVIHPSACANLLPEWWGAVANGTTDCTAAFQAAVDTSDRLAGTGEHQYTYNKPIFLAGRRYRIAGTITSKQGALFIGQGPTGANAELCTSIYHDPPAYPTTGWDRNLFVWDAGTGYSSEASGCAVGGGLKNLNIAKATGKYGGKAIYMKARAATHRPTEFKFENLIISAEGYSSNPKRLDVWDRIMHVDGTAVSDENGYGLRNTSRSFQAGRATTPDIRRRQTCWLKWRTRPSPLTRTRNGCTPGPASATTGWWTSTGGDCSSIAIPRPAITPLSRCLARPIRSRRSPPRQPWCA
jgi:hypothetical protein